MDEFGMQNGTDPCGFYEILGVVPWSTATQITREYHQLALKYHPDNKNNHLDYKYYNSNNNNNYSNNNNNHPNNNNIIMMQKINEAYAVIGNTKERALYDRFRGLKLDIPWTQWRREFSGRLSHWFDPDPVPSIDKN